MTTQSTIIELPNTVSIGGTGLSSATVYCPIAGGTSSTAALQMVSTGQSSTGYVLTSSGSSSLPTFQATKNSALVLLKTTTASNVANVVFNSTYITSTYSNYMLVYSNVAPVTNGASLYMEVSKNNGGTWINTGYQSSNLYIEYNSTSWGNGHSTTLCYVNGGIDNTTTASGMGVLQNVTNGSTFQWRGEGKCISGGNNYLLKPFSTNTATNVNAIILYMSTGNISTGTFSLYGIAHNSYVPPVTAGNMFSMGWASLLYLKQNLTGWGSGGNAHGELGNQTTTDYSSPISIVGGLSFTYLTSGGYNSSGIDSNGQAWIWGDNSVGQIGNNTTTGYSSPVSVVGNHTFKQIALGYQYTLGLKTDGSCWSWGYNLDGQLGNNTITNYSSPVSVVGNHTFVQVCASGNVSPTRNSFGLKSDGTCWSWGKSLYGELGNQTNGTSYSSPISVVGNHTFTAISAGAFFVLGLKSDGSCWSWGGNGFGQIGNNTTTSYSSPVSVVGNHYFIQVCAAVDTSYGLTSDGHVWAWGNGGLGQIGNNTTTSYSSPVSVVGPVPFISLPNSLGYDTPFAMDGTGQLWAWGANPAGEIGNNTTTSYSSPVIVLNTP